MLATALVAAYLAAVRPWMSRWGATTEETRKALAGDELVPNPAASRHAPSPSMLPSKPCGLDWCRSAYCYEWLENLAGCRMRNAEQVHAECQERAIGDMVYLHHAYGLPVACLEREGVLALKGWGTFVVERLEGQRSAWTIGSMWLSLTVVFEFVFGHYVAGESWTSLVRNYDARKGRICGLVPIAMAILPAVVRARHAKR